MIILLKYYLLTANYILKNEHRKHKNLSYRTDFLRETDLFLKICDLIPKVRSFAQNKIFEELTKIKVSKAFVVYPENCLCSVRLHYNFPCKHI